MIEEAIFVREAIRRCTSCPLVNTSTQRVPWSGPTPSKYLFVGMAPGITEDKEGQPFVGSSGFLLRQLIREAKFPKDVAFANTVCCFPGRTNNGGDNRPTPREIQACRPNLMGQLRVIAPKYIFLVGTTALEGFAPHLDIKHVHGKPLWQDDRVLWTIYHPAAALRNRKYEAHIREDLHAFWTWRRNGEFWPEECYICCQPVEHYDELGFGMCGIHAMRQAKLPLSSW